MVDFYLKDVVVDKGGVGVETVKEIDVCPSCIGRGNLGKPFLEE